MKTECTLFICATCLIAFILCQNKNNSPMPAAYGLPKNAELIDVQGNINEIEIQHQKDLTPNPIIFIEGQQLEYTCFNNNMTSYTVHWILQKHNITVFSDCADGTCTVPSPYSTIKMKLYRFDNDSTLSCIVHDRESKKYVTGMTIPLSVKPNSLPPVLEGSEEKVIEAGKDFKIPCTTSEHVYAVTPDSSEIITDQPSAFTVTQEHNGMILFCVKVLNEKREIHDITVLSVKPVADEPLSSSSTYIYIITAVVGVILVGILIFTCQKGMKRKRTQNVNEQPEPLNATSQQVIYAQLHLSQVREELNRKEDESPYAQIIGVLTPKDDK